MFQEFSEEQTRVVAKLEQAYHVWMEALRAPNDMPHNLRIKEYPVANSSRKYRLGSMKSKGPLDPNGQATFADYKCEKAALGLRLSQSRTILRERGSLYRALTD